MLLYLVRHGERATKSYNSILSHDKGLTHLGKKQAKVLADLLKEEIQAIYSSSFPRAMQTAKPIAKASKLKIQKVASFAEVNVGKWNGIPKEKIEIVRPGERKEWHAHPETFRFPGGENLEELEKRVMPALNNIIKNETKHGNNKLCIVAHEAIVIMIASKLTRRSISDFHKDLVDKASITIIETKNGKDGNIIIYNDTRHLEGIENK